MSNCRMPTPPTFDQQLSAKSERDSEEENCQNEFKNADDYGKFFKNIS